MGMWGSATSWASFLSRGLASSGSFQMGGMGSVPRSLACQRFAILPHSKVDPPPRLNSSRQSMGRLYGQLGCAAFPFDVPLDGRFQVHVSRLH